MDQNPAYKHAIKLLSIKDFSKSKIKTKLSDKGFEREDIEETLNKLEELKYINDEEFARSRVRALLRKNYADNFIVQKLKQESLEINELIILEERENLQITKQSQIENLLIKKFQTDSMDDLSFEDKVKFNRYIVSRGFNYVH